MDGAQRRPASGWKSAEPMEQARSVCSIAKITCHLKWQFFCGLFAKKNDALNGQVDFFVM